MIIATAVVSICAFVGAFWALDVARVGVSTLGLARAAFAAMSDEALDDEAREKVAQQASLRLLGAFASILVRSALALLAAFLPIWLADSAGLAGIDEVFGFLARWEVVAVATLIIVAGYVAWVRPWHTG